MEILKTVDAMRAFSKANIRTGKTIALVPTMGFLHDGHLSLIERAKKEADIVVVSIFVNPTQFGPNEDLANYPRDFKKDSELCDSKGVSAIFAPEPSEMYDENQSTWVYEEKLSTKLCGKSRPIHFRGVCTVVSKLFNIVQPDVAIFGQKDAQQALIIKRMVRDLNFPVNIIVSPLIRSENNMALSSRNKYLNDDHKKDALIISKSIFAAKDAIEQTGLDIVDDMCELIKSEISKCHGIVDYVECLDGETLETPDEKSVSLLLAVAAKFGTTRLIDNVIINLA